MLLVWRELMWDRFRRVAYEYRGYRGFNTLDRISIVAMGLGGLALLVGSVFDSDALTVVGTLVLVVGLLTLVRAFPGEGG